MMDWGVVTKIAASGVGAVLVAGAGSYQMNPLAPWQVHAAAAGLALGTYLVGLMQQSPRK